MDNKSNIGRLDETAVHDWYRHVYAYSDRIIADLADEWEIGEGDLLLDPFNGTGTTTVAAKRLGVDCIGADVNPVGVLAGRAKTNWSVDLEEFRRRRERLFDAIESPLRQISGEGHTTIASFTKTGEEEVDLSQYDFEPSPKLPEGWLSEKPRRKMHVLKHHVDDMADDGVTDLFRLAMVSILPEEVANVSFGPEAYRTDPKEDVDVYRVYARKLDKMERDLRRLQGAVDAGRLEPGETEIIQADAREVGDVLKAESDLLAEHDDVDCVITSPPYPAEHDYTRNQRLEMVWMDAIWDNDDLRDLKQQSIRSHTKNIYATDDTGERLSIRDNDSVDEIVTALEEKLAERGDVSGFEESYPRVAEEYFAEMVEHLDSVYGILADGGRAGYVVADQQSYWNVPIETGRILGELAENRVGFEVEETKLWRNLQSTTGQAEELAEEILVLRK